MGKKHYYAVKVGRKPGIYQEWFGENGAEAQVKGHIGAVYKGFAVFSDAQAWFNNEPMPQQVTQAWLDAGGSIGFKPDGTLAPHTANSEDETEGLDKSAFKAHPPRPKRDRREPPEHPNINPAEALAQSKVVIFTDGACTGNPGRGGYGVVILNSSQRTEISAGYLLTTNNRMELLACIVGLESLKEPAQVVLYSDSRYVVNGIRRDWAKRWRENGWMLDAENRAKNSDLWARLLNLCEKHQVQFEWVRGHTGNRENERCDQLSTSAAVKPNLPPDIEITMPPDSALL